MARTARERIESDSQSQEIYRGVLHILDTIGPYHVEEKATSFHITQGRAFLGVHPRRGGLLLNLVLESAVESTRWHRVERVSAARWHHALVVRSLTELDEELIGWLHAAYDLTR